MPPSCTQVLCRRNGVLAALDVGSSKVACIIGRNDASGLKVLGSALHESHGVKSGTVTSLEAIKGSILEAVDAAERLADTDAVVNWAKSQKGNTGKLGIIGFCRGGRTVWEYAAHNKGLKAGVAFYGSQVDPPAQKEGGKWPKSPTELAGEMKAPVLGLYGEADQGIPVAQVEELLGSLKSERAVSLIAIHAHGIPHTFPIAVQAEADTAKPATLEDGREDWRKLPLVTIDPADAKDHDDAVHAAIDPDPGNPGGFILTVAIADVAHYVRPGSALDREALHRGNSVYFPDRVVPMLPERISNDLCSLRPNEDRAALAVRMIIAADGRKKSHTFHRVLMRSAAKLSYQQAQAAVGGTPDDVTGPLLDNILKPLYAAYDALKRARDARGPLDLDLPERKIVLKHDGTVDRVITPERLESHRLIEEFMILANVAAAETLEHARVPQIYRVHDEPSVEKIEGLRKFLESLHISFSKGGALRAEQFNRILDRVKGQDVEKLINEVVLRSQSQAEYSAQNYGHFGLNLRRYSHFTSPIRRYADLVIHRGLIRARHFGADGLPDAQRNQELAEIAALTEAARNKPVATLPRGATRSARDPHGDSWLGNVIADSQLAYARKQGPADVAFMNPGGIRADLTVEPGKPTTMSDLLAIQPFGNDIMALTLTGQQLLDILQRQLPKGDAAPRMLQPSSTLRYEWRKAADGTAVLGDVQIGGQPLDPARDYRVVVNNFLSEGGDAQTGFKHGRDRAMLGTDIDALVEWLRDHPEALPQAAPGRIIKR